MRVRYRRTGFRQRLSLLQCEGSSVHSSARLRFAIAEVKNAVPTTSLCSQRDRNIDDHAAAVSGESLTSDRCVRKTGAGLLARSLERGSMASMRRHFQLPRVGACDRASCLRNECEPFVRRKAARIPVQGDIGYKLGITTRTMSGRLRRRSRLTVRSDRIAYSFIR